MAVTKPLPCSCCPRPFAELVRLNNGQPALLIKARHEAGGKHANILTLEQVKQMLAEFEAVERRAAFDAAFENAPGITKNADGTYTSEWKKD